MIDWIAFSENDPWWITTPLLVGRLIAVAVMIWWTIDMLKRFPEGESWNLPWRLSWPWCLTWWLSAAAMTTLINIIRVLVIGHIREQNVIGQGFRYAEVAVAVNFSLWSLMAFWRWSHPKANGLGPQTPPIKDGEALGDDPNDHTLNGPSALNDE